MSFDFYSRDHIPPKPGLYWVVKKQFVRFEGTIRQYQLCDRGHAHWDGETWDGTEDWDLWYGETQKVKDGTQTKA